MEQLNLFEKAVLRAVHESSDMQEIYAKVQRAMGVSNDQRDEKVCAGKGGFVSGWKRKVRYLQQTLKHMDLVRPGEERGRWHVTEKGKRHLTMQAPGQMQVAFVTSHGIALFGDGKDLAKMFPGEVELILTSPPYFLTKDRTYGGLGRSESEYVSNLVRMIESWLPLLTRTGSLVLNLGFNGSDPTTGQSSIAAERVLVALEDRLGLHLVQRLTWNNPSKPPSGYWTTRARHRLTETAEVLYWLSLNPKQTKADNRRVLQPYSDKQIALMQSQKPEYANKGRVQRPSGHFACDHSFYADNGGAIPKTVQNHAHESANSFYSKMCRDAGLPRHPAMMPYGLAEMMIKLITEEGDLMADPCAGSLVTALAAQKNNRRWCATDLVKEYLQGAAFRFHAL